MVGRGVALLFGLIMVVLFFVFPVLIERYDVFSLHKFFEHAEDNRIVAAGLYISAVGKRRHGIINLLGGRSYKNSRRLNAITAIPATRP